MRISMVLMDEEERERERERKKERTIDRDICDQTRQVIRTEEKQESKEKETKEGRVHIHIEYVRVRLLSNTYNPHRVM